MLNGLYMAEVPICINAAHSNSCHSFIGLELTSPLQWLHISAFSYGGFLDESSENQTATSQMPENLVFGTSETNSLMTRYVIWKVDNDFINLFVTTAW
jgi:hypothetical protein